MYHLHVRLIRLIEIKFSSPRAKKRGEEKVDFTIRQTVMLNCQCHLHFSKRKKFRLEAFNLEKISLLHPQTIS